VTFFSLVLFVHVLSALLMAAALAMEAVTLNRLGRALTSEEALHWLDFAFARPAMGIASAVVLFLSGGYMTAQLSMWELAWPKVAVQGLVVTSLLGAVTAARMRTIRRYVADRKGELFRQLRHPLLKISISLRVGLILGIVFLMTAQPGLLESAGAIVICASLGCGWALLSSQRSSRTPAAARTRNLQVSE